MLILLRWPFANLQMSLKYSDDFMPGTHQNRAYVLSTQGYITGWKAFVTSPCWLTIFQRFLFAFVLSVDAGITCYYKKYHTMTGNLSSQEICLVYLRFV